MEDARGRGSQGSSDPAVTDREYPGFFRIESALPILLTILGLLIWEWQSRAGNLSTLFFPAPSTIFNALRELFTSGEGIDHLEATLTRLVLGLLLGGLPGLLVGLAMGWSRKLRVIFDPFIASLHPLPKIALLPLVMIIFGIGETSKVVAVAIVVFFPMVINSMAGVLQISQIHFDVARSYGADRFKIFSRIILPGSLPLILAGFRIALNSGLLITIAVELVTAREGLGALIWLSWEILRTEDLYAGLVIIGILGLLFNLILQTLSKRLLPWQRPVGG
jgi:ABC-type nitrate/sulfonate/bicarbonate transport system permease component